MSRRSLPQLYRDEFTGYNAARFQQDVMAGLTVAAVALPLALAFGVASGATAAAGLVTAIIGGLVIGLLSGAPYQISGPTGAMSAVLIVLVQRYGLTFGDVLLDEFARLIRQQVKASGFEVLAMRAGSDEFLLWAPNGDLERGIKWMHALQDLFEDLIRKNVLDLHFHVGLATATTFDSAAGGIHRVPPGRAADSAAGMGTVCDCDGDNRVSGRRRIQENSRCSGTRAKNRLSFTIRSSHRALRRPRAMRRSSRQTAAAALPDTASSARVLISMVGLLFKPAAQGVQLLLFQRFSAVEGRQKAQQLRGGHRRSGVPNHPHDLHLRLRQALKLTHVMHLQKLHRCRICQAEE